MDNQECIYQETLAIPDTPDTGWTQTQTYNTPHYRKLKKMSNTDPTKQMGVKPVARKGWAVPASYKAPAKRLCVYFRRQ